MRRVSNATEEKLKAAGYKTHKGKAIIPNRGGTVHVRRGLVDYDLPDRRERVILASGPDFMDRLYALADKNAEDGTDEGGDYQYGIRIGDASSSALNFPTLDDLLAYLPQMKLHSANASQHMVLVRIEYKQTFMPHRK